MNIFLQNTHKDTPRDLCEPIVWSRSLFSGPMMTKFTD